MTFSSHGLTNSKSKILFSACFLLFLGTDNNLLMTYESTNPFLTNLKCCKVSFLVGEHPLMTSDVRVGRGVQNDLKNRTF